MNHLSGPYQRPGARHQVQGDGQIAVVFRSRPIYAVSQAGEMLRAGEEEAQRGGRWLRHTPAWHASVWDEVRASANGTLLRRIRILITDGTQPGKNTSEGADKGTGV